MMSGWPDRERREKDKQNKKNSVFLCKCDKTLKSTFTDNSEKIKRPDIWQVG